MDNLDILIYAAIAAFLFFRFWSVLGQRDEDQPPLSEKKNPFAPKEDRNAPKEDRTADEENVMVLEGNVRSLHSEALTEEGHARTSLAGILDQIKTQDPSFEEKGFIEGAKNAFTEIIKSFALGDLTKVERFLGPAVLEPFKEAIKVREAEGKKLENKLERIVAADIVAAQSYGGVAILTVEFVSHQINQFSDNDASEKETSKAEEIRDRWIFKRDLKNEDPNWQLVETQS